MRGVVIETQAPVARSAPNRADVACFVGYVGRRSGASILPPAGALPAASPLYRWFEEEGWTRRGGGVRPVDYTLDDATLDRLLDVPVPIDSWELFDRLFAWDERPYTERTSEGVTRTITGPSYLGAAVRSFFAQGGRRCYLVRVGDPWRYDAGAEVRRAGLGPLLGLAPPFGLPPSRVDRATWKGIGHLYGLPEVSFLCLPDLADVFAAEPPPPPPAPAAPPVDEVFSECVTAGPEEPADKFLRGFEPPRLDDAGYAGWAAVVSSLGVLLGRDLREVQLVASVPLPAESVPEAEEDLLGWLDEIGAGDGFQSAFVQLAWPWVKTLGSRQLPAELEAPEAILAGVLARNALVRGSYRSAGGLPLSEVHDVRPGLRGRDLELPEVGVTLVRRVSLLGPTPGGMRVLSDVTTSSDEAYRQASINRLVSAIVRAARRIGESSAFEASGPRLWARLKSAMESLLESLRLEGALAGSAREAYQVRCDTSTMSVQDLDEGRTLVELTFQATAPIERIRVVLALSRGTVSQARAS